MEQVTLATQPTNPSLHRARKKPCMHSHMIKDVLTAQGARTGQVLCLECKAVFPDPHRQNPVD